MENIEKQIDDILIAIFDEKKMSIDDKLGAIQDDSLKFVQFIIEIEDSFNISIREDDLMPEKFNDLEKIIEIINSSERSEC